ncbi:MAG: glycosyltransferase family 2 protein [Patescibacteria group bacterium]|nr:glycosyltransferase family 2 protein [Patescibacteria group bacterium]MDD5490379.1 glycosyltransferase family 2 protein [Patescibacteria group bacterium]
MSISPKILISLVTWNSKKFLPFCLPAIYSQTYNNFQLVVLDNDSSDGTADFVLKNYPEAELIRNGRNEGYVAHNRNIEYGLRNMGEGFEYVLVMNPDIVMELDCLGKLVEAMEGGEKLGSVGPKLKRFEFGEDLKNIVKTDIIDSTGLKMFRSRRTVDRGAGEIDNSQFDGQKEVFGISGALALYRLNALQGVRLAEGEYFDKDYFMYKEDVDLAWRLKNRGWGAELVPKAVAYHYRGAAGGEKVGAINIIKNRKEKSKLVNYYSYKNHLLTLVKNERWGDFLKNFPFIFWYELKKFLYILFFEWPTLKAIPEFFRQLPNSLEKRRLIFSKYAKNK